MKLFQGDWYRAENIICSLMLSFKIHTVHNIIILCDRLVSYFEYCQMTGRDERDEKIKQIFMDHLKITQKNRKYVECENIIEEDYGKDY